MSRNSSKRLKRPQKAAQTEWPEKMKLSLAVKFLGVSFHKVTTLISSGRLPYTKDDLDNRVKLVKRSDLEKILQRRTR